MEPTLTATVLVENSPAEGLLNEHGLSIYLSYYNYGTTTNVLLDFGQSDAFAKNARELGVDLSAVDMAVLSHAHYDHADGMPAFFSGNDGARLYMSAACAENCWSTKAGTTDAHYIGIRHGLLDSFGERIARVTTQGVTAVAPGIHLVPHSTLGLDAVGQRAGMFLRQKEAWVPDGFAHEMSLVFELGEGAGASLAVFSSCSHAGFQTIVDEVTAAFPGRVIRAFVGGLHLAHASDEEILGVARVVDEAKIGCVYTGHCTGAHAISVLSERLGGRAQPIHPGLAFDVV